MKFGTAGRILAERKLLRTEHRFRSLVLASSEVLYRMNADWTEMRQLLSDGFLSSTVEPREAWIDAYIHPDDQAQVQAAIEEAIATKSVFHLEHRVIRADGTLGWTQSRAVPLLDDHGMILEWFGAATDTTPQHEQEEALVEAARLKDEFIATLAHELRNPLAAIASSAQLIEQLHLHASADSPEGRVVGVLSRQTAHLSRLVRDLLDVSRIAQKRLVLRTELVGLRDLVGRVVEVSGPQLTASGHRLNVSIVVNPMLCGDPVRLTQVFTNLIDNAAKYSEAGTDISLVCEIDDRHAIVRIQDHGVGIRGAFLPHVYEKFSQDEAMGEGLQEGMGLGLTLVRSLVQLHGGTVDIRSDGIGLGAEAVVRLPIATRAGADAPAVREVGVPRLSAPRVLLVDDNKDAADVLGMILGTIGAETSVVYDGASALAIMSTFRPTVALIDIGMAPMDGIELAKAIRNLGGFSDVVLIAVTGWGSDEDKRRTRAAGFDHHMTKPVDVRALQGLLASCQISS